MFVCGCAPSTTSSDTHLNAPTLDSKDYMSLDDMYNTSVVSYDDDTAGVNFDDVNTVYVLLDISNAAELRTYRHK